MIALADLARMLIAPDPHEKSREVGQWIEPPTTLGVTGEIGRPIACGGEDWHAHLEAVWTNKFIAEAALSHVHLTKEV